MKILILFFTFLIADMAIFAFAWDCSHKAEPTQPQNIIRDQEQYYDIPYSFLSEVYQMQSHNEVNAATSIAVQNGLLPYFVAQEFMDNVKVTPSNRKVVNVQLEDRGDTNITVDVKDLKATPTGESCYGDGHCWFKCGKSNYQVGGFSKTSCHCYPNDDGSMDIVCGQLGCAWHLSCRPVQR